MASQDHAVVIGINEYNGFPALSGAEHDAIAFADWLEDPAGGDVPKAQVKRLLSSKVGASYEPWREHIDGAFVPFVDKYFAPGGGKCGGRLYVFLAGHGFSDPSDADSAALYAANATFTYSPHISGTQYANWFRRHRAFEEVVLVMDCCRSVSAVMRALPPPFPDAANAAGGGNARTFYAFATEWGFDTRERPIDGIVRGLFSTAFLEGLRNAPADSSGWVVGQAVKDYVHGRIKELAAGVRFVAPDIRLDSNNDVRFVKRTAGMKHPTFSVKVLAAPAAAGATVKVTRGGKNEVESKPAGAVTTFSLARGVYKVEIVGTARSQLFEVNGSDVDVTV